jgi:hypothetical protein
MALLMASISGADQSRWMAGLMEGGQAGPVSIRKKPRPASVGADLGLGFRDEASDSQGQ